MPTRDVLGKAKELELTRVYSHCERRCQRGLSAQNAVLWFMQADEYALDGLREITLGYAIDSGIGLSITVD